MRRRHSPRTIDPCSHHVDGQLVGQGTERRTRRRRGEPGHNMQLSRHAGPLAEAIPTVGLA